ncbi:MAG: penicillin-binding protein activator LpoB [Candidatus Eisenbacteria bacterium]|nr:penicillin-binding protein activator LpoB [Candidatus Latescibacterota bacterium]MBD3302677.1 penicillin-binding protein activator LpoB [Candidatus Eisenbacteria bacterium]
MRPSRRRAGWVALAVALFFLAAGGPFGCSSSKKVTRIDPETTTDLSGRWNDTDSRIVSQEMIRDCLANPWISQHMTETGSRPTVIVGPVRNQTLEHIATGTFVADIERALVGSGRVDVVATAAERVDLRAERQDQWENASEETIKRMGREQGADYMLLGTVQSIEDKEKGTKVVAYQIDLTLVDIESNRKAWIGQKKIKKEISRSRYAP